MIASWKRGGLRRAFENWENLGRREKQMIFHERCQLEENQKGRN